MPHPFRFAVRVAATIVVLGGILACGEKDATPPAPPIVDPVASPNPQAMPRISGTAEFGSTVRIEGGSAVVETTADPYTARWFADVGLAVGANTLSVTATDGAGNESNATVVEVRHIAPGSPATITIDGPATGRAADLVTFDVHVYDDFGTEIVGAPYTLTTDAAPGTTTFTPPATLSFCELGMTTITAQAGIGGPSATHAIAISPGRSVAVALTLSANAVTAGQTVGYTTAATDSCANATDDFIDVYTNAPGAIVAGGTISGLTRAGSWTVVAQVPGTAAVDSETLLVGADASSTAVVLQLAQTSGFVGVPIGYTVTAVDGFGNPVSQTTLQITTTDATAVVDTNTRTITFGSVGTHTVTATLFGGTPDQASDSSTLLITNPDITAPTVAIISPPAVPQVVVAPGGFVDVTVRASDDRGLAQILLQASGSGLFDLQQRLVPLRANGMPETGPYDVVFRVDVGGFVFGDVQLVAQAVDSAGNHVSSQAVTIRVDPSAGLLAGAGVTVSTVAWRDRLRNPRGVAVDLSNRIYVTNFNDAFPFVVRIDPMTPPPNNQTTFVIPQTGRRGEDIVFYDDPDVADPDLFFVSHEGGGDRIARVNATNAALTLGWSADIGPRPRGLVIETGSRLAAVYDDGFVRRYDPAAAPIVASTNSIDASGALGDAWGLEMLSSGCRAGQYRCGTGACIDRALVCNSVSNCGDGSDEGAAICNGVGNYRCANGASVLATDICDGANDCNDGTLSGRDESACLRFAATDNGNNHEAWRFYDNGPAAPAAFSVRIGSALDDPRGIAISPSGRYVYVASMGGSSIFQIDLAATPLCDGNCPVVVSGFDRAWGLVFTSAGDLLVTDEGLHAVFRVQGLP